MFSAVQHNMKQTHTRFTCMDELGFKATFNSEGHIVEGSLVQEEISNRPKETTDQENGPLVIKYGEFCSQKWQNISRWMES